MKTSTILRAVFAVGFTYYALSNKGQMHTAKLLQSFGSTNTGTSIMMVVFVITMAITLYIGVKQLFKAGKAGVKGTAKVANNKKIGGKTKFIILAVIGLFALSLFQSIFYLY